MVAGSAALLLNAYPYLKPHEVKARLMNNAERNILTDPINGRLAEITRIGNGEVRVYDAWADPAAAWDVRTKSGSLSFGQVDASRKVTSPPGCRGPQLLEEADPLQGALELPICGRRGAGRRQDHHPAHRVRAACGRIGTGRHDDLRREAAGQCNGLRRRRRRPGTSDLERDRWLPGVRRGQAVEDSSAWHASPRKSARVVGHKPLAFGPSGEAAVTLVNVGVGTAQNDAYSLLARARVAARRRGRRQADSDIRAVGINTFPVPAGFVRPTVVLWAFAINTWERQTHLLPVSHQVLLDTNRDGIDDYVVLNRDFLGLGTITDGRRPCGGEPRDRYR